MIHAAAEGKPYACFVRAGHEDPVHGDARRRRRAAQARGGSGRDAHASGLQRRRVRPTAGEIRDLVLKSFPGAQITFEPDLKRQHIVDSWPADVDDSAARADWGFAPRFGLEAAFSEYLIPTIRERYRRV